jgi:hypothetical protein
VGVEGAWRNATLAWDIEDAWRNATLAWGFEDAWWNATLAWGFEDTWWNASNFRKTDDCYEQKKCRCTHKHTSVNKSKKRRGRVDR